MRHLQKEYILTEANAEGIHIPRSNYPLAVRNHELADLEGCVWFQTFALVWTAASLEADKALLSSLVCREMRERMELILCGKSGSFARIALGLVPHQLLIAMPGWKQSPRLERLLRKKQMRQVGLIILFHDVVMRVPLEARPGTVHPEFQG